MNPIKLLFVLSVFVLSGIKKVSAQTDSCILYLKTANSNYELRDFDGAIKLLQRAISRCNLDKADNMQAHKLLALAYLSIDNLEMADKEAQTIMKLNPNYAPDKFKDEPKYSALFTKFTPEPVFRFGIYTGFNKSILNGKNYYSISHLNAEEAEKNTKYEGKSGFQIGAGLEYRAYKNLWVSLQGQFRRSNYNNTLSNVENTTIYYSEKMSYIDVPLSAKYFIPVGKISPYIEVGAAFSFLTNALGTTTRDDTKDIVNRIDYRNTSMVGYFGGLGLNYNIKSINVFGNFRYQINNKNVNKENTRYADLVNVFKYYYVDNDFTMNNWQVNVGLMYNLAYKNRRL